MDNDNDRSTPVNPLINLLQSDKDSIRYFKQELRSTVYHYYITEEIRGIDYYLDLINTLKMSNSSDTIIIFLNSYGGDVQTAIAIINAIRSSEANVISCLESKAYSAASLIFLSAPKYIVTPNSSFMIHNYSQMIFGKGSELESQIEFQKKYFKKLYKDIYGGFLTDAEISKVLSGADIWMDSDEVLQRLRKEDILTKTVEDIDPVKDKKPNRKIKKPVKK